MLISSCCWAPVDMGPGFSTYLSSCSECGHLLDSGHGEKALIVQYEEPIGPEEVE